MMELWSGLKDKLIVEPRIKELLRVLHEVGPTYKVSALTGAGISVASGIPDFRSRNGMWSKFDPMEYASTQALQRNPEKVAEFLRAMQNMMEDKEPNLAHIALAELEQKGYLAGIVTQNVDGLHQRAGNQNVYELHGSAKNSDIVLFGDNIKGEAWRAAQELLGSSQVWLIIGTSAEVFPANLIPEIARGRHAIVCEFNLERTLPIADIHVTGNVINTLPRVIDQI
jgi:NAD-dependent deacetylase